jgi:hypothetical protein
MKNISDATDLMATARDALLSELLPALPKDRHYAAMMVANALAIASREHQSGREAVHGETERLVALLAGLDLDLDAQRPCAVLRLPEVSLLRRAASVAIREGRFDGARDQAALRAHIRQTSADWLAISNPKALRPEALA